MVPKYILFLITITSLRVDLSFAGGCDLSDPIDLRETTMKDVPVRKQSLGLCYAHSAAQMFEAALKLQHKDSPDYDSKYKNWQASAVSIAIDSLHIKKSDISDYEKRVFENTEDNKTPLEYWKSFIEGNSGDDVFKNIMDRGACSSDGIKFEKLYGDEFYTKMIALTSSVRRRNSIEPSATYEEIDNIFSKMHTLPKGKKLQEVERELKAVEDTLYKEMDVFNSLKDPEQIEMKKKELKSLFSRRRELQAELSIAEENYRKSITDIQSVSGVCNSANLSNEQVDRFAKSSLDFVNFTNPYKAMKDYTSKMCTKERGTKLELDKGKFTTSSVVYVDQALSSDLMFKTIELENKNGDLKISYYELENDIINLEEKLLKNRLNPIIRKKIRQLKMEQGTLKREIAKTKRQINKLKSEQQSLDELASKSKIQYPGSFNVNKFETKKDKGRFFEDMCNHFRTKNALPVNLSYNARILTVEDGDLLKDKGKYEPQKVSQFKDDDEKDKYIGMHASLIIGIRKNKDKGNRIEYLIRNSWGEECEYKSNVKSSADNSNPDFGGTPVYAKDVECDKGNLWVSEDRMMIGMHKTQTIKMK
jgi:hypothetical protein